jgi:hypothetical protein
MQILIVQCKVIIAYLQIGVHDVQYYDMITNQLPSALDYRMYLTHNADDIIKMH